MTERARRWAGGAFVRLEVQRGRMGLLIGLSVAAAGLVAALLAPGGFAVAGAFVAVMAFFFTGAFAPLATLGADKMLGHLELDRTLPLPLGTVALGRLVGASARTTPIILALLAVGAAIQSTVPSVRLTSLAIGLLLVLLAYWCVLWVAYALISRFSMRRLVWVPGVIWLGIVAFPKQLGDAIEARLGALGDMVFRQSDPSTGLLVGVTLLAVGVAAVVLVAASAFVSGSLARFQHDPSVLAGMIEKAPKRELVAAGRGPLFAIARLRLRLATARFRRELLIIGVLFVLIVLDVGELAKFGRTYVPIIASMMAGLVAIQLGDARAHGRLEAMQQLPHSRRLIGVGHVLAVMALALPAVVILAVLRITDGTPYTLEAGILRWAWLVAAGTIAAAMVVWLTRWRFYAMLAIAILGPIAVMFGGGYVLGMLGIAPDEWLASITSTWSAVREATGIVVPLAFALGVAALGNELFAWGLSRYSSTEKPKPG